MRRKFIYAPALCSSRLQELIFNFTCILYEQRLAHGKLTRKIIPSGPIHSDYMYFFFLATNINLSYNSKEKMPRSALDFAFLRAYTCEITTSSNIPGSNIT